MSSKQDCTYPVLLKHTFISTKSSHMLFSYLSYYEASNTDILLSPQQYHHTITKITKKQYSSTWNSIDIKCIYIIRSLMILSRIPERIAYVNFSPQSLKIAQYISAPERILEQNHSCMRSLMLQEFCVPMLPVHTQVH